MAYTIGLSTPTYSTRAVLLSQVDPVGSNLRTLTRRVSRTATLDGGAVLTDQGYSDADLTLSILARVDETEAAAVEYLLKTYPTVVVACEQGCFLAALSYCAPQDGGQISLTALVTQRLSEA